MMIIETQGWTRSPLPSCLPTDRYCKLLSPWKRAGESSDRELSKRALFQHSIHPGRSPGNRRDAAEPHKERVERERERERPRDREREKGRKAGSGE